MIPSALVKSIVVHFSCFYLDSWNLHSARLVVGLMNFRYRLCLCDWGLCESDVDLGLSFNIFMSIIAMIPMIRIIRKIIFPCDRLYVQPPLSKSCKKKIQLKIITWHKYRVNTLFKRLSSRFIYHPFWAVSSDRRLVFAHKAATLLPRRLDGN